MKWLFALLGFAAIQVAWSTVIEKRASTTDPVPFGYATQNGGTTGGTGGPTTTVTSLAALTSAVAGNAKKIVIISECVGTITGNTVVKVGSNTSILGARGSSLVGVGLRVLEVSNVIIRNVKISKVLADAGDALALQEAHQVWVDHVDLSSDRDHDKDYYDGLLDITHGSTGVTVSNSKFYNHWKGILIGHSDSNGAEDTSITVTLALNYWNNLNSRTPSFRFGRGHIFNNVFDGNSDGVNTRDGAQLLVENNVFINCSKPIYSTDQGFVVARGNDFGGGSNSAPAGSFSSAPYSYPLAAVSNLRSSIVASAGQTLTF
ncbi:pectate lyase [Pluteus cervinus]|uniref:Pectate lyase n=1 Tax=Pluteus cervinus TaxID=181527 RepID=A0ACD3AJL2_9AGAR|nr:pectate lyase [Pluteus cervinus]